MRTFSLLTVFAVCVAVISAAPDDNKFTTKYDNIDIDEILKNDRLLENYFKCILEQGNCTPDGEELKKSIPVALQNKCASCSEKQKEGATKVVKFLVKNKVDWFKQLEDKYDKDHKYREDNKDWLEKEGIQLP